MRLALRWVVALAATVLISNGSLAFAQDNPGGWNPTMMTPPPSGSGNPMGPPPTETPDGPVIPPSPPETPNTTPDMPSSAEGDASGILGDDKFGSVYNMYASAWTQPLEDSKYGAKSKARFDAIVLKKKFHKVLGQRTKVTKFKQGKPQMNFEVELLDNSIAFVGSYSKTYTVVEVSAQFFIGPVPVVVSAGAAASVAGGFNANVQIVGGKSIAATAFGAAGIGVTLAAGVGFKFGCIGIEGMLHILKATLDLTLGYENGWKVHAGFLVATSGEVNLVAKVAFVKKRYPIWKSPTKTWFEKTLLDKSL